LEACRVAAVFVAIKGKRNQYSNQMMKNPAVIDKTWEIVGRENILAPTLFPLSGIACYTLKRMKSWLSPMSHTIKRLHLYSKTHDTRISLHTHTPTPTRTHARTHAKRSHARMHTHTHLHLLH